MTAHESPVPPLGDAGDLALPRPPGGFRSWLRRHPRIVDGAVIAAYALPSAVLAVGGAASESYQGRTTSWGLPYAWWWTALAAAVAVGLCVVLTQRRRRPVPVLVITAIASVVPLPSTAGTEALPVLVALYGMGAFHSSRGAWIGFAAVASGSATSVVLGAAGPLSVLRSGDALDLGMTVSAVTSMVIFLLIATLMGTSVGNRRRYTQALIDRAAQLVRERDAQARIAGARERSRIAGEMHDVIAHSVSVMIALAEGPAAASRSKPEQAAETMAQVAETGRGTLAEVRRLLGVLHEEGEQAERRPQPGAAELDGLAAGFRAAGMRLELRSSGEPTDDQSLGLVVYRIVQESLTNALRYAPGAAVTASVHWSEYGVGIEVVDDGPGGGQPSQGAGRGLVGLRERAALYAGTVEAGPRPEGGWSVSVTLRAGGTA